jgi:hypothetical protein
MPYEPGLTLNPAKHQLLLIQSRLVLFYAVEPER